MTQWNAESMHRLAKLALDAGEVATPEEALELFSRYRLHLHLGTGWADTLAGQACFLTALNTAVRAFLGGVFVSGDLDQVLSVPLYEGRTVRAATEALGGAVMERSASDLPTLVIGRATGQLTVAPFCIQLSWDGWCAAISPAVDDTGLPCAEGIPLSGVVAAALGVNEAFLHVRGDLLEAGHRGVGLSLWHPLAVEDWQADAHRGPALRYLPRSLWLVGLGHLGQAYAWTLGMLPYPAGERPHLVLQDFDSAATSNLSTCLLLSERDLRTRKVRAVAQRLEAAGFVIDMVERRFGPHHHVLINEPTTALFGVDNTPARRDIDSAGFAKVVEAGLGSGYRDFRNIRMHTFPSPKRASELWPPPADIQRAVELNNAYKSLALAHDDLCGMTQLASRAVATPFVGALASALVLAEVVRPLHGGCIHATLDLQMKDLGYRTGSQPVPYQGLPTPYVQTGLQVRRAADVTDAVLDVEMMS